MSQLSHELKIYGAGGSKLRWADRKNVIPGIGSTVEVFALDYTDIKTGSETNHKLYIGQLCTAVEGKGQHIGTLIEDLRSSRDTLVSGLASELTTRADGDTGLQNNIDAEEISH